MPSPKASTWERKRDGMKTFRNSAEKMPPFFMAPLFLMLKDTERFGCRKWNSLGGMFSGLLDQSDTQSALFFKASTSFSPSTTSSSDCRSGSCLWSCSVPIHAAHPTESSPCLHCGWRTRKARAPGPRFSHCHYHCHCCCSLVAPPRNC